MLVAFSLAPAVTDADGGVAEAVAEVVRVVRASGLPHETNAMFTNVEGEWDEVMDLIKSCVLELSKAAPRVSLVIKVDHRPGAVGALQAKVDAVEARLAAGG